jgi:hypothetical protein
MFALITQMGTYEMDKLNKERPLRPLSPSRMSQPVIACAIWASDNHCA